MNALNIWIFPDFINKAIIFDKRGFFSNQCFEWLFFLYPDMAPEAEYFLAYLFLEAIGECQRDDHNGHTDNCSYNGQADDEPGKGSLLIKCYAVCYKACNLQNKMFVLAPKIS